MSDVDGKWRDPVFRPTLLPPPMADGNVWIGACEFCAALVLDIGTHAAYHRQMYALLGKLVEKTGVS